MNLATQIAAQKEKGFTAEQAEVITLMRIAAGVLFLDFPDSFLLVGGATLLLFHDSVRHSSDLDLLSSADEQPTAAAIQDSLSNGLASAAEALNLGPLQFDDSSKDSQTNLWVQSKNGRTLFRIDLTRFGSVLECEVEEHPVNVDDESVAQVKSASRNFLLLQKAECFLFRKVIKSRDGFDIHHLVKNLGAALDETLKNHLADTLMADEIEAEDIVKRIEQVDNKRCRSELQFDLPRDVFEALAKQDFKPLRDALYELYAAWL